jgi:2-keto-4-pentenoate hydratase
MNLDTSRGRSIDAQTVEALADALLAAETSREPIDALTATYPQLTVEDAYAVQQVNTARKLAAGHRIVGRKVGLTSLAMQQQLGVDQPDYGAITDDMLVQAPATIDLSSLIASRVEGEFAFRVGRDVPAGIYTPDQLRDIVDEVYVSMEIIDSRIANWKIKLADTIADNASSARLVIGVGSSATSELFDALPETVLTLERNGQPVASGAGREVLGDPIRGALWVVNRLGELGEDLRAGEIILAGAVHASVPLEPGVTWSVNAPGFSSASITTSH